MKKAKKMKKNAHYMLDIDTHFLLCDVSSSLGITQTDVVNRAVRLYANSIKYNQPKPHPLMELAGILTEEEGEKMMEVYLESRDTRNRRKIKGWID